MIISRTPFRISFVGGGTDIRAFYKTEPGKVISLAIDKYIYVVVKRQIGIVEYKYRINWSKVEFRNNVEEIEHPIVREALKLLEIDFPVEITTFADIPANTGLGSSSAFTVGLLHALYALNGQMVSKYELADRAARIEVDILGRNMGKQDHFASAYGGLNVFTFNQNETVNVEPVFYSNAVREELEKNLLLFYTKLKRDASEVLTEQVSKTESKRAVLREMSNLVDPLRLALSVDGELDQVGQILHRGWELKKLITSSISSKQIDRYYQIAITAGSLGGKLLGAGGGGFLLTYTPKDRQKKLMNDLQDLYSMRIKFDVEGTRISYYEQTNI